MEKKTPDVIDILDQMDIEYEIKGKKAIALCPNPEHQDTKPSWDIVIDPKSPKYGNHYCFSCSFGGKVGTLYWVASQKNKKIEPKELKQEPGKVLTSVEIKEKIEPIDAESILKSLVETKPTFKLENVQFPTEEEWRHDSNFFGFYALTRDLLPEDLVRFGVGISKKGKLANHLVFVNRDSSGQPIGYSARAVNLVPIIQKYTTYQITNKELLDKAVIGLIRSDPNTWLTRAARKWNKAAEWNLATLVNRRWVTPDEQKEGANSAEQIYVIDWDEYYQSTSCTLVEGALKTILAKKIGFPAPIGLFGAFLNPVRLSQIEKFETIYVLTDPDQAGEKVIESLQGLGKNIIRIPIEKAIDDMDCIERAELFIRFKTLEV